MGVEVVVQICKDMDFVRYVVTDMWDLISEDGCGMAENWEPDPIDIWLEISVEDERIGLYVLHPWNGSTYEAHISILSEFRGKYTDAVRCEVRKWLDTNCNENTQKFIAYIASCHPNVIQYTKSSGWKEEGVMRKAYMKNGELHDLHQMGITREELRELL